MLLVSLAHMNDGRPLRQEIIDTAQDLRAFAKTPRLHFLPVVDRKIWIAVFLTIALIDIALDNVFNVFFYLIETNGYKPPTAIDENLRDGWVWFTLMIYAPLIEEPAFRGWINGKKRNLMALALLIPVLVYEFTAVPIPFDGPVAFVALLMIVATSVWWSMQSSKPQPVPTWFSNNFRWIVYTSALAFGLIHVGNYTDFEWGPDLLYILPQAVGGLLMTYTRLRLGLRAAMLHHAVFNVYFLVTELL